jgi:hypothetical protein
VNLRLLSTCTRARAVVTSVRLQMALNAVPPLNTTREGCCVRAAPQSVYPTRVTASHVGKHTVNRDMDVADSCPTGAQQQQPVHLWVRGRLVVHTHTLVAPCLIGDEVPRPIKLAISPGAISLGSSSPSTDAPLPLSVAVCSDEAVAWVKRCRRRHRIGLEALCSRNALTILVCGSLQHTQAPPLNICWDLNKRDVGLG